MSTGDETQSGLRGLVRKVARIGCGSDFCPLHWRSLVPLIALLIMCIDYILVISVLTHMT